MSIRCQSCGGVIDDHLETCPRCGARRTDLPDFGEPQHVPGGESPLEAKGRIGLRAEQLFAPTAETSTFLAKLMLVSGICVGLVFFLPWAIIRDNVVFSWWVFDTRAGGSASFLVVWLLLSGIGAVVLGLLAQMPDWVRSLAAMVMGFIPLLVMFGEGAQKLMQVGGRVGASGMGAMLPLSLMLLAFGTVYWAARTNSTLARVLVGAGIFFCLLAYLVPHDIPYLGKKMPIAAVFQMMGRTDSVFAIFFFSYSLLPLPAALVSALVFPPAPNPEFFAGRRKAANALGVFFILFLPGYFVILSLVAWANERTIFFPFFFAVVTASYLAWVVLGGAIFTAWMSRKAKASASRSRQAASQPAAAAATAAPAAVPPGPQPAPAPAPDAAPEAAGGDLETRMRKLKSMLEQGLITQEEFDQKKKELLASL